MAIRDRPFLSNVVARLVVYYAVVNGAMVGIHSLFPMLNVYILAERGRHVRATTGILGADTPEPSLGHLTGVSRNSGVARDSDSRRGTAMIFSFLLALPVAWVYTWSRFRRRAVHGFAPTLVLVPLVICDPDEAILVFGRCVCVDALDP